METLVENTVENSVKYDVKSIKKTIKEASELQRYYKNQRKSVNIIGAREIPEWEAAYKHSSNRSSLRHLYAAYAIARGKDVKVVEQKNKPNTEPLSMRTVDSILAKYLNK